MKNKNIVEHTEEFSLLTILNITKDVIPIAKLAQESYKYYNKRCESLLLSKLEKFLWAFQDIPIEERQEMLKKLESDNDYKHKVGEQLILLLEKMEDMHKPVLLARAFIAYAKGLIDVVQLQRINFGIVHVFTYNLSALKQYYLMETDNKVSHNPLESSVLQNLANCGFIDLTAGLGGGIGSKKNELGKLFVEHILQDEEQL